MSTCSQKAMRHLSLCLIILASCRSLSPSGLRVSNPIDAGDRYPEVVRIEMDGADGSRYSCSGTFVTKSKILTAAHCFFDLKGRPMTKITYADSNGVVHVGKMTASADFNPSEAESRLRVKKDIGLVSFSADVAPAVAKDFTRSPVVNMQITLVGFGVTSLIDKEGPERKTLGTNSVEAIKDNRMFTRGYASNAPQDVEAGTFSASLGGDSGGAVFNERHELIGVMIGGKVNSKDPLDKNAKRFVMVNIAHPISVDIIKDITTRNCRGDYLVPKTSCLGQTCGIQ